MLKNRLPFLLKASAYRPMLMHAFNPLVFLSTFIVMPYRIAR